MNPTAMFKLMGAKKEFERNHPKFAAFAANLMRRGVPEGTVIEIKIERPGEEPVMANMKVQQSDLELLASLKEMGSMGHQN